MKNTLERNNVLYKSAAAREERYKLALEIAETIQKEREEEERKFLLKKLQEVTKGRKMTWVNIPKEKIALPQKTRSVFRDLTVFGEMTKKIFERDIKTIF